MKINLRKIYLNIIIFLFIGSGMWISYLGTEIILLQPTTGFNLGSFAGITKLIGLIFIFIGTIISGVSIACLIIKNPLEIMLKLKVRKSYK